MTQPSSNPESRENSKAIIASSNERQAGGVDAHLESAMVSGEIAEVAKTQAAQNASGASSDDDEAQELKTEEKLPERELLKRRLLSQAPSAPRMKRQVQSVLEKERDKLEADVRKYRRKKDYHMLSKALLQLRRVVHQLQILARASAEALQDMWLKVIHKFA